MVRLGFDVSYELRLALRILGLQHGLGYRILILEALKDKYPELAPIITKDLEEEVQHEVS